ncbi:hypothetical protein LX32DRAFT_643698 [Colletotrichum zoysiae]|uniref:Uncharacterized protein n=1 Tax=Colletotrichum zoysiae TaxID=1216348 RepID=A0AAD9H8F4_9PEZI|nr:hypothetical protein LX32DRAFT_643698 [Colletotrichum zoysiae]
MSRVRSSQGGTEYAYNSRFVLVLVLDPTFLFLYPSQAYLLPTYVPDLLPRPAATAQGTAMDGWLQPLSPFCTH